MVIDVDRITAVHLWLVVHRHVERLRRNGKHDPELAEFEASLLALLRDGRDAPDHARVLSAARSRRYR